MSQQINLYNPLLRKRRYSLTSASALLSGVGFALAAAALAAVYLDQQARETAQEAQAVNLALKEANARRNKLLADQAARRPNVELAAEMAALDAQLKSRQEIIDALKSGALGTTAGFSEYMRAFSRQRVTGLWLTGFDIAAGGNDLLISGRALSADLVPSYLKRLNQEQPLQGRQFAALRIQQPAVRRDPAQAKNFNEGATPARPRYLEFTLSTGDLGADANKTGAPQVMSQAPVLPARLPLPAAAPADITASAAQ